MFKVSLRELFLLVTIAALGVAWWLDRNHLVAEGALYREASMKFRRMGFDVGEMLKMPELTAKLNAEWDAEHRR
jgi:hypothetical protein